MLSYASDENGGEYTTLKDYVTQVNIGLLRKLIKFYLINYANIITRRNVPFSTYCRKH